MGTTRLGWCLTGHHDQCWEWTESGDHCGCPCHIKEDDMTKTGVPYARWIEPDLNECQCPECGLTFTTTQSYAQHYVDAHTA